MFKTDETLEKISAFALTEGQKGVAIIIINNNILGFLTKFIRLLDEIA